MQTILDIHRKYNTLVMTAFSNDSGFVESLDKVGQPLFLKVCLNSSLVIVLHMILVIFVVPFVNVL